jgi:hypothetical protein
MAGADRDDIFFDEFAISVGYPSVKRQIARQGALSFCVVIIIHGGKLSLISAL